MTATMSQTAATIVPCARVTLGYGEALLAGITPDKFARKAEGVDANHPAWNFGHLSIYPDMLLEMIGKGDLADPKDGYEALFSKDTQCKDDPEGSIYPPMDEIMAHFKDRHEVLINALEGLSDEDFARPNPRESMADRFPTVGAMANFMLVGHCMMHHGQTSTWRRAMGLGSAM